MSPTTDNITPRVLEIVSDLPRAAKLLEADAYRDSDFGPGRAGVTLEFSTGHLCMVMVDATEEEDIEEIESTVAMVAILHLAFRPAERLH